MPISRERFEKGDFKVKEYSGEDYVLKFLQKNSRYGFKADEIAVKLKKSSSIVRKKLRDLIKQRLVKRKSPYYILAKKKQSKEHSKSKRKR